MNIGLRVSDLTLDGPRKQFQTGNVKTSIYFRDKPILNNKCKINRQMHCPR